MNLEKTLTGLNLNWIRDNLRDEVATAARKQRSHQEFVERLFAGEQEHRDALMIERRLKEARLPARRSMKDFDWSWPKKINADQVRHLFKLGFLTDHTNAVLIAGPGLGKTHIAIALACEACQQQYRVLFTSAAEVINTLTHAMTVNRLGCALRRYLVPALVVIDELGYAPVDRVGADLLFQVFSGRYERGSTIITTNRAFRDWAKTFANDSTLASAVVDRVVHHCETVTIEGLSYRLKGQIDPDEK